MCSSRKANYCCFCGARFTALPHLVGHISLYTRSGEPSNQHYHIGLDEWYEKFKKPIEDKYKK